MAVDAGTYVVVGYIAVNVGDERVIIHIYVEQGSIVDTAVYGKTARKSNAAGKGPETDHSVEIDPDNAFRSKPLRDIDMLPVLGPASLCPEGRYLFCSQLAVTRSHTTLAD